MASRLLSREDTDVSECIQKRFVQEGIDVRVNHTAQEFLIQNGEHILLASQDGLISQIPFDQVLLALGRAANLSGYGVDELDIAVSPHINLGNQFVPTD